MAAAAAEETYTLDVNLGGNIIIKKNGAPVHTTPLGDLLSPKNGPYNNVGILERDQKMVNYMDAIKDGTEVNQLKGLKIYDTGPVYPKYPDDLHAYENGLLEEKKGNLSRTSWLKTKITSKLNLIQSYYVFWESGLGYESFVELLQHHTSPERVTFGSYIDPLSKPGDIWPPKGESFKITDAFMKQFGFESSSITAKTIRDTIETSGDNKGKSFNYNMKIACGLECIKKTCTLIHNGSGKDPNEDYFGGNEKKNKLISGKSGISDEKIKLIVAKGWGDKVQVMLYYMYYCINKDAIMITCDIVVFCFCVTLNIPCVYTGIYSRDVKIQHQEVAIPAAAQKEKKSYYSILQFIPGTALDTAKQNYKNTIIRIANENQEFIDNVSELSLNPNTPINVQGTFETFDKKFYDTLVTDMKEINQLLEARTPAMEHKANIDEIIKATDDLKKNFLIIPMFKFIKTGTKITFLQTKLYTSDKTLKLSINQPPYNKVNSMTFCHIAHLKLGGAITRAQARVVHGLPTQIMEYEQKKLFPRRDYTKKIMTFLPEDLREDVIYENEKGDPLFIPLFVPGFGSGLGTNLQSNFDINMYRAIESLSEEQGVSDEHVEYNRENRNALGQGGRRRRATRRRQKGGGGVDETLFETLYTLYVYRAQYDIELNTHDQSIKMDVLKELYKDYPKSMLRSNSRMTLNQLTEERMVTYTMTGRPVHTLKQPANMRSQSTGKLLTGRNVPTPFDINSRPMILSSGGRITRRKKRYRRRTRK